MNLAVTFSANMLKICSQFQNLRCAVAHQQLFNHPLSRAMSGSLSFRTVLLKRKHAIDLHQTGHKPKKLRGKHFIYQYVEDAPFKKEEPLEVILTQYVDGIGKKGEKVKLKRQFAYNNLLLPKLAVYANPENEALYGSSEASSEYEYSSKYAPKMVQYLSKSLVAITMNKEVPWTLEAWHIRACARKAGILIADDSCIEMPEKEISGPDLSLETKEFLVTVTINKKEKAKMRCRIHHWSTEPGDRIKAEYPWFKRAEPIFEEQAEELSSIPLPEYKALHKSAPDLK
ncbi:Hypothetical predicted protein [Cloeon dipterum]|uniref:Large ribosomal subunit protein bL9m n=1 Tax=Cloeon dipterum TaxID=197152 RepID=A0A8S1CS16_9INSE|nr:Hypothetical predicted protein [Cloeon dipterum]